MSPRALKEAPQTASEPVPLPAEYLAAVDAVERRPANRDGADKTWVGRAIEAARQHWKKARRVST